ncbi:MAG: low molecular weight phosphatase family protein [Archaeoglobaceae archaeon]|nr:low molecular weight phosphatase family protein [Archaeoglobaceae archaeon]MCX8152376.1 low molecular weight phosphatase family protein [Archaeoglobaceae archaeon]MDW8013716.1 low molecular weight phosphatase family protein [Archaeoglobaceae archaeon]
MDKMKVLFVCIYNTARSVIAETIFNSLAKNWIAESAGIKKAEEIDPIVRKLLNEKGLKVKEKPQSIWELDLEKYDLIVTVCEESNCIILPTKKPVKSWYIEDPKGKSKEVYEKVFKEIEEKVKELVEKID